MTSIPRVRPNPYLKFNTDHARECTLPSSVSRGIMLNNLFLFLVNHMIETVAEKPPESIAGPSHTSTNTGTALDHHELAGVTAN